MQVSVDSRSPVDASADVLTLPLSAGDPSKRKLPARVAAVDRALGGRISAILSSGDFRGKRGESVFVYPDGEIGARRILLVGMGEEASLDAEALRCVAGTAVKQAAARRASSLTLAAPTVRRLRAPAAAQALAEGAVLAG